MKSRVTLEELRSAITRRLVASFDYEGASYRVEPHMLGNSPRYHAYVLVARCLNAEEQWRAFRYAMIHNWNVHQNEKFDALVDIPGSVLRNLEMIETTARRVRF